MGKLRDEMIKANNIKKSENRDKDNKDENYSPENELNANDKEYKDKLAEIDKKMEIFMEMNENLKEKLGNLEVTILARIELLEGKVTDHEEIVKILEKDAIAKKEVQENLSIIKKNHDLNDYFHSFVTEIQANYIAGFAVKSGQIKFKEQDKYKKAAGYLGMVASLVPFVGTIGKEVLTKGGAIMDSFAEAKNKLELERITDLASTQDEFDQIIIRIAIIYTVKNKSYLESLQEKKVLQKKLITIVMNAVMEDTADVVYSYMKKTETESSLKGKLDSISVISYLQNEDVAENIRKLDTSKDEAENFSEFQAKANKIVNDISNEKAHGGKKERPQQTGSSGCCDIF